MEIITAKYHGTNRFITCLVVGQRGKNFDVLDTKLLPNEVVTFVRSNITKLSDQDIVTVIRGMYVQAWKSAFRSLSPDKIEVLSRLEIKPDQKIEA